MNDREQRSLILENGTTSEYATKRDVISTTIQRSDLLQRLGNDTNKVISQKGVTEEITALKNAKYVLRYPTYLNFPTVGDKHTLYIDETENESYIWKGLENIKYKRISFDYEDISIIDGGIDNG